MGCFGSKSKAFTEKLDAVQRGIEGRSWRHRGDLRILESLVDDLVLLFQWFSSPDGKDFDQLGRIQRLGDLVTEELHTLMDVRLIRAGDLTGVQTILRAALKLDKCRATKASEIVGQKHKAVLSQLGKEQIQLVDAALKQLTSADRLLEGSKQVNEILLRAKLFVTEVPELVPLVLQYSTAFSVKILEFLPELMARKPRDVPEIHMAVCVTLDDMCTGLAKSTGRAWDPVAPKVQQIRTSAAIELANAKLDALEGELGRERDVSCEYCVQLIGDIVPLWLSPSVDQLARTRSTLASTAATIQSSFDQAVSAGDTGGIEGLVATAKEFDKSRQSILGASCPELIAPGLQKKKAGVTLNALVSNSQSNVFKQSKVLHTLCEAAQANVLKVLPRERLDEPGEGFRWKFKLGSGNFKDFSEEKCAEVERLYQDWIGKGRPADDKGRRYEIAIQVRTDSSVGTKAGPVPRDRCKYGAECFRKNVEHRRDFCHPNDWDWSAQEDLPKEPPPAPPPTESVGEADFAEIREERFSLDFLLMTQVNLSRRVRGMRNINRTEGMTVAQKLTCEYFEQVMLFVKEAENTFSQAEAELHFLGGVERSEMEKQVEGLVTAMTPALREFLQLAVFVRDKKVVEEVMALLGVQAERLHVADALKDLRLSDVLGELKEAYAAPGLQLKAPKRWNLLRLLCRHQKAGPPNLLKCRLALVNTKNELSTLTRRRVQMRCQAVLSEYEGDKAFCAKFRREAAEVLQSALWQAATRLEPEVMAGILRTAVSWQCELDLTPAGELILRLARDAAHSKNQPLSRVVEVLDAGHEIAKAAQKSFESFCNLQPLLPALAQKSFAHVRQFVEAIKASETAVGMPACVKKVLDLRAKIRGLKGEEGFDGELWVLFEPWYKSLAEKRAGDYQTAATEWAIAYCEQLKIGLPSWMMDKNQVDALRKLQAAVESGSEKLLREAVVFAKQADYKSEAKLLAMYDEAVGKLRHLKRLPSGWEVEDLVGDDADHKMFKKVDIDSPIVKQLFQQVFDETRAAIVTRDRTGSMPRGYRVEKIISVMNVDSWGSYMKRCDEIGEQCKRFKGAAPCPDSVWKDMSGPVQTANHGNAILTGAHLPPLSGEANEFLMFHGTKPEAADSIAANHFDMAFACKTGLFGAGLYFAESSSKSDEYVKGDARDWFPMIFCRVTLGRINYCASKDPVSDPGRDKLESSCIGGEFHSVLGDRKKAKGTYREFVVYDHYQVYPHFIVWYTRV